LRRSSESEATRRDGGESLDRKPLGSGEFYPVEVSQDVPLPLGRHSCTVSPLNLRRPRRTSSVVVRKRPRIVHTHQRGLWAPNGVQDVCWCQGFSSFCWPRCRSLRCGRRPLLSLPGGRCPSDRGRSRSSIRSRRVRRTKVYPFERARLLSIHRCSSTRRLAWPLNRTRDRGSDHSGRRHGRNGEGAPRPKELHEFALEAVRQWKFARTCLNGTAIRIIHTVVLTFPGSEGGLPDTRPSGAPVAASQERIAGAAYPAPR
jgi:hypothetical protein